MQLSTLPVAVCYGSGVTSKDAQASAAQNALEYLKIMTKKWASALVPTTPKPSPIPQSLTPNTDQLPTNQPILHVPASNPENLFKKSKSIPSSQIIEQFPKSKEGLKKKFTEIVTSSGQFEKIEDSCSQINYPDQQFHPTYDQINQSQFDHQGNNSNQVMSQFPGDAMRFPRNSGEFVQGHFGKAIGQHKYRGVNYVQDNSINWEFTVIEVYLQFSI